MKNKNANYKLNQKIKKLRQTQINQSQKNSSQLNDDSLDIIQKINPKPIIPIAKNHQEISEDDLNQLRTCISNQFKKSNFIHFSAIKNNSHYPFIEPFKKLHQISETQNQNINQLQKEYKSHTNKKNFLASHNRSQSCPFIQPLYSRQNVSMKQRQVKDPGIVFSSIKDQNSQKKKISMKNLAKNRNKFLNMTGNTQNKVFNHNYSNSLTQSSNTVIVHNIPNQIHTSIVQNQNLSSILYKKAEEEEETETKKQRSKPQKVQNCIYPKIIDPKKSGFSSKTLQKKSLTQVSAKHEFYIKTKIQQRITKYKLKEQKQKLDIDTRAIYVKGAVLEKLLKPYRNHAFQQGQDTSLQSIKESIVIDNRSAH